MAPLYQRLMNPPRPNVLLDNTVLQGQCKSKPCSCVFKELRGEPRFEEMDINPQCTGQLSGWGTTSQQLYFSCHFNYS